MSTATTIKELLIQYPILHDVLGHSQVHESQTFAAHRMALYWVCEYTNNHAEIEDLPLTPEAIDLICENTRRFIAWLDNPRHTRSIAATALLTDLTERSFAVAFVD
jgi:hypothetical protein